MGRNAFETAREVLSDGFEGDRAVAEWMARINSLGQRYCALALDLILVNGTPGQYVADPEPVGGLIGDESYTPLFDGMFSFPDVPGEPVVY